jgi:hypothetical protein
MPILDRRIPEDFRHVDKYRLSAVLPDTVPRVERFLSTRFSKDWRIFYDQGSEGACVGFGESQLMTYYNRVRYDARWLWNEAKRIDEWDDTNPGDNNGTSLRAGFDVLRNVGHCRSVKGATKPPSFGDGIAANRWCTSVDEMRTAIANGSPCVMGTNWYEGFNPGWLTSVKHNGRYEWRVKETANALGRVLGGHCYVFWDASDDRQAFRMFNTWGLSYPPTWFGYGLVERLLSEYGEAGVVTDR